MSFKVKDHYYKKAKKENFYARSVYKLEEVDAKYEVVEKTDQVLDLGYYPGSWVQYVIQKKGFSGQVRGVDIQEVNEKLNTHSNVKVYQKSIHDIKGLDELEVRDKFDVVLSDMAPKTTGVKMVDQLKSLELVEMVFYVLPQFLKVGGDVVVKVFESNDAQEFLKTQRPRFEKLANFRPQSTRKVSKEFFVIGKGFKGE